MESKLQKSVIQTNIKNILLVVMDINQYALKISFCWICDNDYIDNGVKVRDHCHITGKYIGSAHKGCNSNLKSNHKISFLFQNLKNYDSHLIMQKAGKFNFRISIITNGLEKCMSFTINNELNFIGSFQFLSSSLDSLNKTLNKVT